jgi:putative ATP-dependent endonuclease of the OLD family
MKLDYLYIKGFRRITEATIFCGDATFLIGENNIGKSSVLKALETYFSEKVKIDEQDFFKIDETDHLVDEVVLEGKFIDLPAEAYNWRGFKSRIIVETINGNLSNCIYYRKTFYRNGTNAKREMKCFKKSIGSNYSNCKTLNDYIIAGINENEINEIFEDFDKNKTIPPKEKDKLELISDIWEIDETDSNWDNNPGGIEGNISIRLPKFLLIPAENRKEEIEGTSGTLQKTMKELFDDVRDASPNYKQAQHYLDLLAKELDPNDENKEFGKMISDINGIISGVFINTKIHIDTNLSDPSTSIKPAFDIEMSSNVRTKPERQGMGSIRSTVFALLRYREDFVERKKQQGVLIRPIIIGFEEPEMYLHPNAASLMRDKIYELATSSNSKIICTTHSPYMIDLGVRIDEENYPKQVLNLLKIEKDDLLNFHICKSVAFNTSNAYRQLQNDEKDFVKFLLKVDDYIAKVFFCKKVIIVEGDTEELLLKETVNRLPDTKRRFFLSNYQVIKARGKASIISLVKYLRAMSILPFVIHDRDQVDGATKFNQPILDALDNNELNRLLIENTIEDILGYDEPTSEKPYKAFKHISNNWGDEWLDVQENWRIIFEARIASELFVES